MSEKIISVRDDFSEFPGGRYREDGTWSGQEFRDDLLVPALKEHDRVTVVLDGTAGYPSSFLEEAFGGLVRTGILQQQLAKLQLISRDPHYETYRLLALKYMSDAKHQTAA